MKLAVLLVVFLISVASAFRHVPEKRADLPSAYCYPPNVGVDCNIADPKTCEFSCYARNIAGRPLSSNCVVNENPGIPVTIVNGSPFCPEITCYYNQVDQRPVLYNATCCEYIRIPGCLSGTSSTIAVTTSTSATVAAATAATAATATTSTTSVTTTTTSSAAAAGGGSSSVPVSPQTTAANEGKTSGASVQATLIGISTFLLAVFVYTIE